MKNQHWLLNRFDVEGNQRMRMGNGGRVAQRPFRLRQLHLPALLAAGLLMGLPLSTHSRAWQDVFSSREGGAEMTSEDFAVMPGDVVKIQFYSELNLKGARKAPVTTIGGDAGNAEVLSSFYERTDLSGEYEVDQQGNLSHPLLGLVQAKGLQLPDLEKALRTAFESKTGNAIADRVTFVRRSPIYVLGLVSQPGAYQYVPGVTIAQLVALASGVYRSDSKGDRYNANLENIKLNKFERTLRLMYVRQARLKAELDSKTSVEPSAELISLVGREEAVKLASQENMLYQRSRAYASERVRQLNEEHVLIDREMADISNRRQYLSTQETVVRKKLLRYGDLYKTANLGNSMAANKELASFELQHLNLQNDQSKLSTELLGAKRRKLKIEQELLSLKISDFDRLKKELDALNEQLVETQGNLDQAHGTLKELSRMVGQEDDSKKLMDQNKIVHEVTRSGPNGFSTFIAGDNTYLKPGDVIRIKLNSNAS